MIWQPELSFEEETKIFLHFFEKFSLFGATSPYIPIERARKASRTKKIMKKHTKQNENANHNKALV
jgi:hypothetical protein